jgi:hypothetical protein
MKALLQAKNVADIINATTSVGLLRFIIAFRFILLLTPPALLFTVTQDGGVALMAAAYRYDSDGYEIVELLLNARANVNASKPVRLIFVWADASIVCRMFQRCCIIPVPWRNCRMESLCLCTLP